MARRDMMASVTAFLNCLIVRYMGRMANRGKVCTFIIMVMKAIYKSTLMKPVKSSVYSM